MLKKIEAIIREDKLNDVKEALREIGPRRIIYVSCNPESLGRDLEILKGKYAVDRLVVVDLFPHTDHVETVVRLVPRG